MHPRVQRLDPAVEALGEAGQVLDLGDREAEPVDQRGRAAGRDERDAGVVQAADQVLEAGLVVDRDERAPDRDLVRGHRPNRTFLSSIVKPSRAIRPTASTSIRRSATLIRSCSVVDGVVVLDRHRRLGDDRAGVDARVDDEQRAAGDLDAVRQRVGRPVHAGERRRQRRVGVDDPAAEAARNSAPTSFMKPASTTRSGSMPATVSASARSQCSRLANWPTRCTKVGTPARSARARPSMPSRSAPTATTRGAVRRVGARVEQRLQVGAGPRDEDDEARGARVLTHGSLGPPAGAGSAAATRS